MDPVFVLIGVLIFVAVALAAETLGQWWFSTQSRSARRFRRRLQALGPASEGSPSGDSLLRERRLAAADLAERWLRRVPFMSVLDRYLQQSGSTAMLSQWLLRSALAAALGAVLGGLWSSSVSVALLLALVAGALPVMIVMRLRTQRLQQMERQLPEVADLIARSLRAGHALPATLQMIADEMPEPISQEFRIVSDEITFGLGLPQAMQRLAARVPLDDLRFLVISVLIQRETGGNLAELMSNLAALIRERMKLFGQVRVLSAEGRLSGWILFLLPLLVGGMLLVINPHYINTLLHDPNGPTLLTIALAMQLAGGLWMRRIIRIRP